MFSLTGRKKEIQRERESVKKAHIHAEERVEKDSIIYILTQSLSLALF